MDDMIQQETSQAPEWAKTDGGVWDHIEELKDEAKTGDYIAGFSAALAVVGLAGVILSTHADSLLGKGILQWVGGFAMMVGTYAAVTNGIEAGAAMGEANVLQAALIRGMMEQN